MNPLNGLQAQLAAYMSEHHVWYSKGTLTADIEWRHRRGKHAGVRYLPETVGRALRRLEEKSVIAVKGDGVSVQYKWIPHGMRSRYIPISQRNDTAKDKLFRT